MKKILLLLLLLAMNESFAQQIQQVDSQIDFQAKELTLSRYLNQTKVASCAGDTNQYAMNKATGLSSLSINNATSAQGISQYFNAPQSLTLSGVEFFAYKLNATGGLSVNVNIEVYLAGADSMPTGAPVASAAIAVDTALGGGVLNTLRKLATFTPVTVSQPYVVVMSNPSPNGVGLIFNSYTAGDGAMEWLVSADLFGTWTRSYGISVGGSIFDADALFQPIVSYNLAANFTPSDPCFLSGNDQVFTNGSSPVNADRMYNVATFLAIPELTYTWNYGDASATENLIDGVHTYSSAGSYNVTLTDTLYGWTSNCFTDTTIAIGEPLPVANWSSSTTDLTASFTDLSAAPVTATYSWDFGDGNTSTLMEPSHTYAMAGTYTVCLTVTGACGNDIDCQSVTVTASSAGLNDLIDNQTVVYPNPASGMVNVSSKELMNEIRLLDLTGKTIETYTVNALETSIDLSNLAQGHYMLEAAFLNGSKSNFRILVQQ